MTTRRNEKVMRDIHEAAEKLVSPSAISRAMMTKQRLKAAFEQLDAERADPETAGFRARLVRETATDLQMKLESFIEVGFSREEAIRLLCAQESRQ